MIQGSTPPPVFGTYTVAATRPRNVMARPGAAEVFNSANTSLFAMARLMKSVRNLTAQARDLQPTDTRGIELMRAEVSNTLAMFSAVGRGPGEAGAPPAKAEKPLSLAELRTTLADMQKNLTENFDKLGKDIMKALAYREPPADVDDALAINRAALLADYKQGLAAQADGLRPGKRFLFS